MGGALVDFAADGGDEGGHLGAALDAPEGAFGFEHVRTRHHAPEIKTAFVERFNGSLKYERLYREETGDVLDLDAPIRAFIELYNAVRPHEALGFATPLARYLEPPSDDHEPNEYVDALRTTLGPSYDPDNHPVTEWLDYYTRISLDRLEARNRILDALPTDIGILVSALADAGDPLEWASTLLAARVGRLRTAMLAEQTDRSMPAARAELGRMARSGWLEPRGVTRGRWYAPTDRLNALPLHIPELMSLLATGEQLRLFDEALAG